MEWPLGVSLSIKKSSCIKCLNLLEQKFIWNVLLHTLPWQHRSGILSKQKQLRWLFDCNSWHKSHSWPSKDNSTKVYIFSILKIVTTSYSAGINVNIFVLLRNITMIVKPVLLIRQSSYLDYGVIIPPYILFCKKSNYSPANKVLGFICLCLSVHIFCKPSIDFNETLYEHKTQMVDMHKERQLSLAYSWEDTLLGSRYLLRVLFTVCIVEFKR